MAINTFCVSLLRYSGGIVGWTQAELHNLDVMTRNQFTLHGGLARKGDTDRLYVSRKLGGRGLISIHYAVEHEKHNLANYVHHSQVLYMTLVANTFQRYDESGTEYKSRIASDHFNT